MSLILELPPELEATLRAEAAQLRLPLQEYALRLLATGRPLTPKVQTGAELVTYWQAAGLIGTRPDVVDAPGHARTLRQQAERQK